MLKTHTGDWEDYDVESETDRDGGALEDANEDAMEKWAEYYDDLDGAPENDDDR
jgi:hypothetical protein